MPQVRVPRYIPGHGKSYALLTETNSPELAVVFVHGLGGKPTSTWLNFHSLVDEYSIVNPWWSAADLFFYAYESLRTPIRRNADLLEDFLKTILHCNLHVNETNEHRIILKYKSLVLAGHSEGAVVIRRLILDRYETLRSAFEKRHVAADAGSVRELMKEELSSDPLLCAYLRLFAPACMGTNFSSWIGFLTSLSQLVSASMSSSLVRNELLAGSPVLTNLKSGTEQAHRMFPEVNSLQTEPIFGVPDQVVYSESYEGEGLLWDEGYDHFSVCKPQYSHPRPLEFVAI